MSVTNISVREVMPGRDTVLPLGIEDKSCQVCGVGTLDEEWLLICDGCEQEYHTYCLSPALHEIPEGDWFCPLCSKTGRTSELQEYFSLHDETRAKMKTAGAYQSWMKRKRSAWEASLATNGFSTPFSNDDTELAENETLVGQLVLFHTDVKSIHTGRVIDCRPNKRWRKSMTFGKLEFCLLFKSGADSRNMNFSVWCVLEEHACAVGSLHLNVASVSVHKLWTTTHIRPKPCFRFLQSRMGLAIHTDISMARENYEVQSSTESASNLRDNTWELAFIRFFTKINNVYATDSDKKLRTDAWSFVNSKDLREFSIPSDYYKADALIFAKAQAEKTECEKVIQSFLFLRSQFTGSNQPHIYASDIVGGMKLESLKNLITLHQLSDDMHDRNSKKNRGKGRNKTQKSKVNRETTLPQPIFNGFGVNEVSRRLGQYLHKEMKKSMSGDNSSGVQESDSDKIYIESSQLYFQSGFADTSTRENKVVCAEVFSATQEKFEARQSENPKGISLRQLLKPYKTEPNISSQEVEVCVNKNDMSVESEGNDCCDLPESGNVLKSEEKTEITATEDIKKTDVEMPVKSTRVTRTNNSSSCELRVKDLCLVSLPRNQWIGQIVYHRPPAGKIIEKSITESSNLDDVEVGGMGVLGKVVRFTKSKVRIVDPFEFKANDRPDSQDMEYREYPPSQLFISTALDSVCLDKIVNSTDEPAPSKTKPERSSAIIYPAEKSCGSISIDPLTENESSDGDNVDVTAEAIVSSSNIISLVKSETTGQVKTEQSSDKVKESRKRSRQSNAQHSVKIEDTDKVKKHPIIHAQPQKDKVYESSSKKAPRQLNRTRKASGNTKEQHCITIEDTDEIKTEHPIIHAQPQKDKVYESSRKKAPLQLNRTRKASGNTKEQAIVYNLVNDDDSSESTLDTDEHVMIIDDAENKMDRVKRKRKVEDSHDNKTEKFIKAGDLLSPSKTKHRAGNKSKTEPAHVPAGLIPRKGKNKSHYNSSSIGIETTTTVRPNSTSKGDKIAKEKLAMLKKLNNSSIKKNSIEHNDTSYTTTRTLNDSRKAEKSKGEEIAKAKLAMLSKLQKK